MSKASHTLHMYNRVGGGQVELCQASLNLIINQLTSMHHRPQRSDHCNHGHESLLPFRENLWSQW